MTSEERRKRLAQLQSGSVAPVEEVEPKRLRLIKRSQRKAKVIQSNSALAREKRLERDPTAFERIVSEPFGRAVEDSKQYQSVWAKGLGS